MKNLFKSKPSTVVPFLFRNIEVPQELKTNDKLDDFSENIEKREKEKLGNEIDPNKYEADRKKDLSESTQEENKIKDEKKAEEDLLTAIQQKDPPIWNESVGGIDSQGKPVTESALANMKIQEKTKEQEKQDKEAREKLNEENLAFTQGTGGAEIAETDGEHAEVNIDDFADNHSTQSNVDNVNESLFGFTETNDDTDLT